MIYDIGIPPIPNEELKKEKLTDYEEKKEIIRELYVFSHQFLEWRKVFKLKKHLLIYRKSNCPLCETKVIREKTGKRKRWSF